MNRMCGVCVFLFLFAMGYGTKAEDNKTVDNRTFVGDQITFTCHHPLTDEKIALKTSIPEGWAVNPDFGTVVYQPPNAADYFEAPHIEFQARCEGECKAEAIPMNIEEYIQRLKYGWKKLSTGNAELDKLGTNVEIIKEEKSEGQWLFEVKLTYPEGVSSAMYPPRYYIYRFLHDGQDPFFILIIGMVPVNLADQFLADVRASCLSTTKQ